MKESRKQLRWRLNLVDSQTTLKSKLRTAFFRFTALRALLFILIYNSSSQYISPCPKIKYTTTLPTHPSNFSQAIPIKLPARQQLRDWIITRINHTSNLLSSSNGYINRRGLQPYQENKISDYTSLKNNSRREMRSSSPALLDLFSLREVTTN